MKKRFLLLTLIMCLLGGVMPLNVMAQEEVTIGEGKSTSTKVPYSTWTSKNGSQSIYSCTEINQAGTITHIAYKIKSVDGGKPYTRQIKVYLKETDKANYNEGANFVQMTTGDVKYEGDYSYTKNDEWITIELTGGGFVYSGEKNLIISIEDNTGTAIYSPGIYIDDTHFYADVFKDAMAISKSSPINMMASDNKGTCEYCRPQIKLTFVGEDDPETPTAPTVVSPTDGTTISGTTVDLSWSYGADNTATHYQVSLGIDSEDLSPISGNEQNRWVARTELGTGGFATEDVFANVNLEYGKTYYWRVDVKNGEEGTPVEGTIWSFATPASAAFEFITEGNWNVGANWNGGAVPGNGAIVTLNAAATITAEDNITVTDLIISENASLTINGSLTITGNKFSNTDASKLVINDGGQIFQKNAGVKATFNMNIINPTEWSNGNNINGWQFISSPFTDASINDFVTTGDGNDYDLYKFDGKQVGAEWQNQKAIATFDTQFVPGRGYLASYESKKDVSVSGTLRNELKMNYTLGDYQYNVDLKDFHLVGNPFPFDMNMSKLKGWTYHIIEGYAVVNNGSYSYYNLEGTIPAGDGFFVKVTGGNATFTYDHEAKSSRSGNANSLNIIATGNAGNDNVVVNFNGEGEGFPKLQNFNDAIATVYVQNNDANYGIYNCDENTTEVELCFNANQMGNYTISAQAEGKFETVTLVDRFTGIETNLLVEDYTFTAMSNVNNNRFFIRLGNGQQTTDNSHFAYVSGEDLIIEAEGTVQIIDMMGRVVYSSDAACHVNRINVSEFNNAAYVVRVVNENGVKVEKVVIY